MFALMVYLLNREKYAGLRENQQEISNMYGKIMQSPWVSVG